MMDEAMCLKIAAVLELDPGHVLAAIAAERAKPEEVKTAWSRVARQLAKVGCVALVALVGGLHNRNVEAGTSSPAAGPDYTYAAIRRRRLARWCQAARSAWRRTLGAALVLGALAAAPAQAADWTPADAGWELAFQGVLALDCLQTWKGSGADPQHFKEGNGILNDHPSKGSIAALCAGVGLAHYGITSFILSDSPSAAGKSFWQIGTVLIEAAVVFNNHAAGVVVLHGVF
jgi:hypothetical protein